MDRKTGAPIQMVEPPDGLFGKVTLRVREQEALRVLRRRAVLMFVGFSASVVALLVAFVALSTDLWQSGLFEYLVLAVTNLDMVFANGVEFAFASLEAIPVVSTILFLGCAILCLFFGRAFARDLGRFRHEAVRMTV